MYVYVCVCVCVCACVCACICACVYIRLVMKSVFISMVSPSCLYFLTWSLWICFIDSAFKDAGV